MANFALTTGVVYVRGWSGTITAGTTQAANGSAAAPSYSFSNDPDTGLYNPSAANTLALSFGGVNGYHIQSGFFDMKSTTLFGWAAGDPTFGGSDVILARDAAQTLAQRNGTNAQIFRVYNTWANSGTDYERGAFAWSSNVLVIGTQAGGTGQGRGIQFQTSNTGRWSIDSGTGNFTAAGSGRVYEINSSTSVSADSNQTYTAAGVIGGIITRTGITANRVDAMPTAAAIVAAIPGCQIGTTFDFILNNNDDASTVTLNGASAGITYEGTATALAAGDAWLFRVVVTAIAGGSEAATVYQLEK